MSIPPLVLRASETSILAMAVSSYRKILLFWAIKQAVDFGTLNLMDATSSFYTVGINVGNFGSGIVNVSNGATLNQTGYGFIGGNASGKGIVNISTDSLWNLKTSSTNAQLLQVGVLGKGELNITTGGIVKARDTQIALN